MTSIGEESEVYVTNRTLMEFSMANETNPGMDAENVIFIAVTASISLLMLSAIFINVLIIVAIKKFKRLQIPANFIMINLSVADCSVAAASLVYVLANHLYPTEENICEISIGFAFLTCSASILSLALIAFDRFSALVKPLTYSSRLTNKRIVQYIVVIWTYAFFITGLSWCVLHFLSDNANWLMIETLQENVTAIILCHHKQSTSYSLLCQIFFTFLPGALVMFYCYGRVMLVARHHSRAISAVQGNLSKSKFNKTYSMFKGKKYFVTLTSILGVFTFTWGLFVLLLLLDFFCMDCFAHGHVAHWYFCVLPLLNTGMNPWIYTCRSQDFKAAFMRLYKSAKSCCSGEKVPGNRVRRDSRFSDGLSRTNSMIGNMQYLQALYNNAYYNQKNQNNNRPRTCPPSMTLQSVSQTIHDVQLKGDPVQNDSALNDP